MVKKQKKARSTRSGQAAKKAVKKSVNRSAKPAAKRDAFAVTPLGDRIIVKPVDSSEERTASGFIIPDSAKKEKPGKGTVVAVGEGRRNDRGDLVPLRVRIGDVVMFSKYGFDEITIGDSEYYVVSEPSILAILN